MSEIGTFIKLSGRSIVLQKETINGYNVPFIESGKGTPVILLHGANIGYVQWYKNFFELAQSHHVYALDLPGAGESTPLDFSQSDLIRAHVKTVEEFIKRKRLNNVIVIGHSAGAWAGLMMALRKNVGIQKLVLVNPLGLTNYSPPNYLPVSLYTFAKFLTKTVMKPNEKNMEQFLKTAFYNTKHLNQELIGYMAKNVTKNPLAHPLLLISRISKPFGVKKEFLLINSLSQIKLPILIFCGDHDKIVPAKLIKKVVASYKNIKLRIIKNVGHVVPIEKSDEFNEIVLQFIK